LLILKTFDTLVVGSVAMPQAETVSLPAYLAKWAKKVFWC
jgi:hypothetical protein